VTARLELIGSVASQQLLEEPVLRLELGDQLVECGVLSQSLSSIRSQTTTSPITTINYLVSDESSHV
jgi:hypothetical protein